MFLLEGLLLSETGKDLHPGIGDSMEVNNHLCQSLAISCGRMRLSTMLEKSIIVLFHPDDEVLRFSFILDKGKVENFAIPGGALKRRFS